MDQRGIFRSEPFFSDEEPSVKCFQVWSIVRVNIGIAGGSVLDASVGGKVIGAKSAKIVHSTTKSTSACAFIAFPGLKCKLNSLNSIPHLAIMLEVAICPSMSLSR